MAELPISVSWSTVKVALCQALGLDEDEIHNITEIRILPYRIEVTQLRKVFGRAVVAGRDPLTVVTSVKVDLDD